MFVRLSTEPHGRQKGKHGVIPALPSHGSEMLSCVWNSIVNKRVLDFYTNEGSKESSKVWAQP